MSDRKLYSGLSKKHVLVPAYSVATVDYIDTRPNYFQVQNQGTTAIYCGTASIPNAKQYDFMVAAESLRMFTEPHDRTRLYIFNPSGSDIMTVVLSFNAPFDPLALALSTIEVSMPSEIEARNIIEGFNAPLPSGTNTIGKVSLTGSLPAGSNIIGVVGLQATVTNALTALQNGQKDYTSVLADILEAIGNISGGTGDGSSAWTSANITALLSNVDKMTNATGSQMEAENGEAGTGTYTDFSYATSIKKINFISNDGEYDLIVKFTNDLGVKNFTLKAGEVLNDLEGDWSMVSVIGSGGVVPFRFVCTRFTA